MTKRASYAGEPYWGRPIAGWGSTDAGGARARAGAGRERRQPHRADLHRRPVRRLAVRALHRVGLAAQATSVHAGDGQRLVGTRMVAAVRCAPPDNRPTADGARHLRAVAASGRSRWCSLAARGRLPRAVRLGRRTAHLPRPRVLDVPRPKPRFGHAAEAVADRAPTGRGLVAAGQLPPLAAEHLHRPAHRADARRRAGPGRRAGRGRMTRGRGPRIPTAEEEVLKPRSVGSSPTGGTPLLLIDGLSGW